MDKITRLETAYKFCFLLKIEAIKEEIDSLLVGYSLDDIKLQNGTFECEFSNGKNNTISLSISGFASFLSHLLIACLEVLRICANSSWDIFLFFLSSNIFSPSIISPLSDNIISL